MSFLVPSFYNNNEFLTYEKIENDIVSVSSMTIEEKEHTATFSYKSTVDNSILFSGHIDKNKYSIRRLCF